jgi:Icc-related predicted phosphoesterase
VRVAVISDTHGTRPEVPPADLIIHAGDATRFGNHSQVIDFNNWLGELHTPVVFVPGNHDFLFEEAPATARSLMTNAIVLIHESLEIEGVKIFGSPWTPWFHDWAFNYRPDKAEELWGAIPSDTQVLITHGPPFGILDQVSRPPEPHVGCPVLLRTIERIKPVLHIFGHIHEHGCKTQTLGDTTYINAAALDRYYNPQGRGPWTVDLRLTPGSLPDRIKP